MSTNSFRGHNRQGSERAQDFCIASKTEHLRVYEYAP
jgi:hypothetical protein